MRSLGPMAKYDENPVARGTSRRWEVLMSDDEHERTPARRRHAIDVRYDHRILSELPDTLLRVMPLLDEGTTLERRHEYLDLHDPARAAFRAEGGEAVKPGQRVIARADVSAEAWDELRSACDRIVRRRMLPRAS
jgi:hypothetical protein